MHLCPPALCPPAACLLAVCCAGYAAQFGASVSVLLSTLFGLPVSTTAVLVGAVAGTGLADGSKEAVNLRLIARIVASWVITLPAAGLVTMGVFAAYRVILGY